MDGWRGGSWGGQLGNSKAGEANLVKPSWGSQEGKPHVTCSGGSQAWGAKLALDLLGAIRSDVRRARVVGDNLGVVRYGAEKGHLRRPDMHRRLAAGLTAAAEKGGISPGVQSSEAHQQSRRCRGHVAVFWAHRLRASGARQPQIHIEWLQ